MGQKNPIKDILQDVQDLKYLVSELYGPGHWPLVDKVYNLELKIRKALKSEEEESHDKINQRVGG